MTKKERTVQELLETIGLMPTVAGSVDTTGTDVSKAWKKKQKERGDLVYKDPTFVEKEPTDTTDRVLSALDRLRKPGEVLGRANPFNYSFGLAGSPHVVPLHKEFKEHGLDSEAVKTELLHGGKKSDNEAFANVIDSLKKDPDLAGTAVHLGERPFTELKRGLTNPKTSILSKLLYGGLIGPAQVLASLMSTSRADQYNPFTDTVTVSTPDPAILRHELGHAQDFTRSENPGARGLMPVLEQILARASQGAIPGLPVPGSTMYIEYRANRNAINKLLKEKIKKKRIEKKDEEELDYTNRILGGSYGSYSGGLSGIPIGGLAGIPAGAAAAGATNVWSNSDDLIGAYREKLKKQKPGKLDF